MRKSERSKASRRKDEVDLISCRPDPILLLILSSLESIEEVIRTSVLSSRWRYFWTSVPSLDIDFRHNKDSKIGFQEFIYWVLENRSANLDTFKLCCDDQEYSMSTVGWWIHMAVTRNVKQLDLTFAPYNKSKEWEEMTMPHCLVTCRSLEVLRLCLHEHGLIFPNFTGFPALRVLELGWVDLLYNDGLVKKFLESCPSLEVLSLEGCPMNELEVLCISCQKLKKLSIKNEEEVRMCVGVKICCPKLVVLKIIGPIADKFIFESLDSLKEAVIDPEELPPANYEAEYDTKSVLFPGISHVESLRINLSFFCQGIQAALDPGLPNLKTLVLTTTFDDFTINDFTQTLIYYPKLESLKLIVKERFEKLDEDERSLLTSDLKKVEFLEFNGEKPKLGLDHYFCSDYGLDFMGMAFSWGNNAV